MTVEPIVSTSGGEVLETEYRQRFDRGGFWLQGSGAYNPAGGLGGTPGAQTYGHAFGSGRLNLSDTWRTGFDVQATSNPGYMRFYDISYLDRLVSDLFVEDTPGRSRFALTSYYFQGLRSTDVTARIPYILPELDYSFIPKHEVAGGSVRFDVNGISLGRDDGRDEQRLSSQVNWKKTLIFGDGQLWTLMVDARGDAYRFENTDSDMSARTSVASASAAESGIGTAKANVTTIGTAPVPDYSIERGTAYAALDWRWPFMASGAPGHSYIITPIAQLIAQRMMATRPDCALRIPVISSSTIAMSSALNRCLVMI
jgi:LPS-assembly protein